MPSIFTFPLAVATAFIVGGKMVEYALTANLPLSSAEVCDAQNLLLDAVQVPLPRCEPDNLPLRPATYGLLIAHGVYFIRSMARASVLSQTQTLAWWLGMYILLRWTCSYYARWYTVYSVRNFRDLFESFPYIRGNPIPGHTHGISASHRNDAVMNAQNFADSCAVLLCIAQRSATNVNRGIKGFTEYHWVCDLAAEREHWLRIAAKRILPPLKLTPGPNDMVYLGCTDFHMDINDFCAELPAVPILIYTIVPKHAAYIGPDYSYFFNHEGEIVYRVNGGGLYCHKLWHFAGTTVSVPLKPRFPMPWKVGQLPGYRSYRLSRRESEENHQLILLEPLLQSGWELPHEKPFARLDPRDGEFVRIDSMSPDGPTTSIGRVNSLACVTVPTRIIDGMVCHAGAIGTRYAIYNAISDLGQGTSTTDAALLAGYVRQAVKEAPPIAQIIITAPYAAPCFTFSPPSRERAEPAMSAFSSAFVQNPNVHAMRSISCQKEAVFGRVTKLAHLEPLPVSKHVYLAVLYFARAVAGRHAGTLLPVDWETVYEHQSRPSQRAILQRALDQPGVPRGTHQSFIKTESYDKVKDPRIITTMPPTQKLEGARYMTALTTIMKEHPWYAFCKSNHDAAQRVAEICKSSNFVNLGDQERMDAHRSSTLVWLEQTTIIMAFRPDHIDAAREYHRNTYFGQSVTPDGVKYNTGTTRMSGDAGTSVLTTLCTAFALFLAYTFQNLKGDRESKFAQAWEWLCDKSLVGGDDTLAGELQGAPFIKACDTIGLKAKSVEILYGELGVEFLGRVYSRDVWRGCYESCSGFARHLPKLHLCTDRNFTFRPIEHAANRALSLLLTDHHTIVFSAIARKWLEAANELGENKLCIDSWQHAALIEGEQYPNGVIDNGYQYELLMRDFPDFDWDTFNEWVSGPTSNWDQCPILSSMKPLPDVEIYLDPTEGADKSNKDTVPGPDAHGPLPPVPDPPGGARPMPSLVLAPEIPGPPRRQRGARGKGKSKKDQ
jgi:hypothetical protein